MPLLATASTASRSRSRRRFRKHHVCPIPKSSFTTFSDEGNMHFRAGHYRKALFCFDRALELKPHHQGALVQRSQCYMKLGDAALALKDAEASFKSQDGSGYIMGLYQYAEALFNLGQFEQALIAYHRGYRCRRDKEEFRVGVNKAQDAIRRAIGDRQATQIEDLDCVLPKIDEMNAELSKDHCCVLPSEKEAEPPKHVSRKSRALTLARARWVDREVLGVLQQDKDYLTKFLKRPDIQGDSQSSSEILRDNAHEALNYLEIRERFWREQNPMYARKVGLNFNNDMVLQYEKQEHEKMEACMKIKMDAAQGAVMKNLSQIEHALKIGRAQDCQLECDRALRQIKEISQRLLPRKPEFVTEILHYKGLAFMKMKTFDGAASAFQDEFKVATDNKMTEIKSRALDYLGRSYALKGAFNEGAEIWDSRLAIAKTPIERSYMFHEIGRCYYETNKYDLAKIYANQCFEESMKISDAIWAMNAHILLGQCEVKMKCFERALTHFEQAEEFGLTCNNKGNVNLLREAQQCIKTYIDKKENQSTAPLTPNMKASDISIPSDDD